jgi:hypothetical protein
MRNIVLIAMMVFLGFSAQAQSKKNKNLKYKTEVNGNCELVKNVLKKRLIMFQEKWLHGILVRMSLQ